MSVGAGSGAGIGHVPGLDGLRGLAVAGVLLFHANGLLRGGYLGVDLFFVLSGYLITAILLAEHRRGGRIDLRAFWVRRARRLLPALLGLIPAIAIYARVFAAPGELAALRGDALATLAYVANWRAIAAHPSYWEMFAAPSPLEHTWSLAIEEQFYVVWPLVVVAVLARRGAARALFGVCLVLAAGSMLAMLLLYDEASTMRVYLGTDARGAAILIGAALAASGLDRSAGSPPRGLDAAALAAAAVLGAAWGCLDGRSELLYRGGFWATEIAAATLVYACVRAPNGLASRALSLRPLRALGAISYGVYLWHWPVYVVLSEARVGHAGGVLLALRLAATLAVALASYGLIEQPIRRHGLRFGRPHVVVPAALALALVLVVASTRVVGAAPAAVAAPAPSFPASPPPSSAAAVGMPDPAKVPLDVIPPAAALPPGTMRALVLGDSVALSLGARMHFAQGSARSWTVHRAVGDCSILHGVAAVASMSGAPHGNGDCARRWIDDVKELRPDATLVLLGGAYFSTVRASGRRRGVCHAAWGAAYGERLGELLEAIAPFTGRRAVALAAYPVGPWRRPGLDDDVDCYNRILRGAAARSGADVIDLAGYTCPGKECALTSRGEPIRPDGLHFDGLGAEDTARWVLRQLRGGG